MLRLILYFSLIFSLNVGHSFAENSTTSSPTEITAPQLNEYTDQITPQDSQKKHDEPPPDRFFMELVNMAFTLLFIVVVLLLISWFAKRMMGNRMQQMNSKSGIKIIERRPLTQKSVVYVLDIYGKSMAVVESTNGVVSLGMLPTFAEEEKAHLVTKEGS